MAGSEKTGFEASSDRLIENAYYIITPGGEVALERLTDFTEMISSLGAIPMVLTSESVWKIIRISPMFWMTTSACWFRSNVLWITRTPGVCIRCLQVPGITVILLMW